MRLQISLPHDAAVKMVSVAIDAARAENMLPLTVVVLDAAGKPPKLSGGACNGC